MNTAPSLSAAGRAPAAVAPALLERHKSALRSYVQALTKGDAAKVEAVVEAVWLEAQSAENAEFEEDPTVWLFSRARRRVVGAGGRDPFAAEAGSSSGDDEAGQEGEEPRVVVHRTIGNLTPKQQEALRLKFQFHLSLDEIASVTGQAKSGTGGLLHHAIVRIGKALGAREDDSSPLATDPRVTAYALDEMDASERSYFEKGIANGKALLEREKAIREWGGHITAVLSSGAPVPKRRRKNRGAAWWKSKALWLALALVVALGVFWLAWKKSPGPAGTGEITPATSSRDPVTGGQGGTERKPLNPGGVATLATPGNASSRGEKPASVSARGHAGDPGANGPRANETPAPPINREQGVMVADDTRARDGALPAKPDPDSSDAAPQERAAVVPPTGAGKAGKATGNSVPTTTGTGKAEKEIELVADQPGRGKPEEDVEAVPTMGGLQRQLARKQWPQRGQVRLDKLLRNVPPPPPRPAAHNPIELQAELVQSPWDARRQIMRVSLRAKDAPVPARGRANVVFAIDVSKSMIGPNRLPLVQEGVRRLVERLRPDDLVSVVTYAAKADRALMALPAARSGELRHCLAGLEAAGLTNGSAGLRLAYETARSNRVEGGLNVVVLCTDGNFNLGTTDETALAALAAAQARDRIQLSVFGFGRTDRNDLRLEVLATNGGGRSCYVNTEDEVEQQLAAQIDGLLAPVARDVELQVRFDRRVVSDYRRIGDLPAQETAGAVAGLLPGGGVTALFELTPGPGAGNPAGLGRLRVGYTSIESGERQQQVLTLPASGQAWDQTGLQFRFAVAMAEFGRILHEGQPADTAELDRLETWARENLVDDAGGYRTELLQNLALARAVVQGTPATVPGDVAAKAVR